MNKINGLVLSALTAVFLVGCGGGGGSSSSSGTTSGSSSSGGTTADTYSVSGSAQKGPLIYGSYVWVSELDDQLNTTGKVHITQTTNDLGNFSVNSKINTKLVEILADGYYLDETTGNLDTSKITLSAIADLSIDSSPTVNVLTTLQMPRLKELLSTLDYRTALIQSQKEVLKIFNIDSEKINNLNGLFAMQIDGNYDPDSVLLATSAIMMQMATTEANSTGASKAAELTYFISQIANDISKDGTLNDTTLINKLNTAAVDVNLSAIRSNIETYYASKGTPLTAPKFEEWVDKDNTDLLPKRLLSLSGISFTNLTNVESKQTYTSNPITISGAGSETYVYVDTNVSGSIIKNGNTVSGSFTTAVDGDTIAYKLSSNVFGNSTSLTGKIGSQTFNWNVTTKTPTIRYASSNGNFPFPGPYLPGDNPAIYHAFPLNITETFNAKYVASSFNGFQYNGVKLEKISIYSDNNGVPSTELGSSDYSIAGDTYFNTTLQKTDSSTISSLNQLLTNGYFGANGISLTAGDRVWLVCKFPSATDFGSQGNSAVGFSNRKVSSDGTSWTDYAGQANGRESSMMPMVLLTD